MKRRVHLMGHTDYAVAICGYRGTRGKTVTALIHLVTCPDCKAKCPAVFEPD
jgi:hypothetical protein